MFINELTTTQSELLEAGEILPIMEHFYTIQGEGFHQGKASYFIRTAGCDVGCHWCDVKESWDAEKHPLESTDDLTKWASAEPARVAIITGGESLMYNLDSLTKKLQTAGFQTHIETSGAHPLSGSWDWICLSPKKFKAALPEAITAAHELKVIIFNQSDFTFAEKYAAEVSPDCLLYLQPEWGKQEKMLPIMIDYVKNNPKWRICLQTHKFMNIP